MRNRLLASAALAPFCAVCLHAAAWAQTDSISNTQSTPISTATAVSGGPGDIDVTINGTVNIGSSTTPAITLNSNNNVSIEGSVISSNANGAVGVLATSGVTGSIENSGSIVVSENFTAGTNNDGYTQEPFATGNNRYGIETLSGFNGAVGTAGSITVQGNNSYGIAILGGIGSNSTAASAGNLVIAGTVSLVGDNDIGVYTAGEITGQFVRITGTVTAQGAGSIGVKTTGQIDGQLLIESTVTSYGFATVVRPTTSALLTTVEDTPAQVELGGAALQIQANVLGGVMLGAPPAGTTTTSTTDTDGDGFPDDIETTATVTSYGTAPAIQIGGPSPITLGNWGACATGAYGPGDNCFGLIVEGTVVGQGIYDNFAATAVDIGAGANGVNLSGGIRIASSGSITAQANQASATALHLESGVQASVIQNEGAITSSVTSTNADSSNAVLIESGATVGSFINFGPINADVTGDTASAYAVVDRSGTINSVTNYGTIEANISPTNAGDTTTGSTVAFDLSHNTTGVTFIQTLLNGTVTPQIIGDVLLSPTGPNTVQILSGAIHGTLNLGSAPGTSLLIDNGAAYVGSLIYTGSGLSINVNNGLLQNNNAQQNTATGSLNASSLTVGASGELVVALDPANTANPNTRYNVSGAASLANGATIGTTLLSTPAAGQTFTVIQASSLSVASTTALLSTTPYLFTSSVQANTAAGTLTITIEPKPVSQLGLNKAEAAAFPAIYAALPEDSGVQNAILNATTSSTFHSAYQLLLPDSAGDVFQVISAMSKSVARASVGAAGFVGSGSVGAQDEDEEQSRGGLWASEYIFGLNQARGDNEPYDAVGLGLIAGLDIGGLGGTVSFASANVSKPDDPGDSIVSVSRLEAGLYASPNFGILHTDFRVGAGFLKVSDRREFAATVTTGDVSANTTVSRTADESWTGYDLNARAGVGAQFNIGSHFFLQPQAHLDIMDVHEGAYGETGGGPGFDLNVSARDSTESSVTGGVVAGLQYGKSFVFKPQIELGWDEVLTGGPGDTTAKFAYGGPAFTVPADAVGGGAVARISLKGDGDYVHFDLQAGGEFRSDYQTADVRFTFRVSY